MPTLSNIFKVAGSWSPLPLATPEELLEKLAEPSSNLDKLKELYEHVPTRQNLYKAVGGRWVDGPDGRVVVGATLPIDALVQYANMRGFRIPGIEYVPGRNYRGEVDPLDARLPHGYGNAEFFDKNTGEPIGQVHGFWKKGDLQGPFRSVSVLGVLTGVAVGGRANGLCHFQFPNGGYFIGLYQNGLAQTNRGLYVGPSGTRVTGTVHMGFMQAGAQVEESPNTAADEKADGQILRGPIDGSRRTDLPGGSRRFAPDLWQTVVVHFRDGTGAENEWISPMGRRVGLSEKGAPGRTFVLASLPPYLEGGKKK